MQRAPFWIVALVGVLGVWRLWSFIDAARTLPAVAAAPAPAQTGKRGGVDIAAIQRAHMFGSAAVASTPEVSSTTGMMLIGAFSTDDPERGYAIVGMKGSFGVFHPGEEVLAGVHLQSIYRDYVLLEQSGVVSRLEFSERQPDAMTQLLQADAASPVASQPISRAATAGPVEPEQVFQVQVARSNGKVQGFRVRPGAQPAAFLRAGLQAGDVVVAVNGQRDDVMSVLRSARTARLTILRNGTQQDVTLNLDGPT